ncbi:hypothetical protein [Microbacterium deminutum]|uniref:Alpha/beta hydrolase n=1 Tax=Microbacterium deminutum TaxID=344164 RepID=A0ABP5C093_9MICO
MSDDLDIRSAGAIAVDTATLRTAAAGFVGLADELADLAGLVGLVQSTLGIERAAWDAGTAAFLLARRIIEGEEAAQQIAGRLREAAAVYEMAELNASYAAAAAAGDWDTAARIDRHRAEIAETYPAAEWNAWGAQFEYNLMRPSELVRQWTETGQSLTDGAGVIVGGAAYGLARTAQALGRGTIERTERLGGAAVDVHVRQISASSTIGAPTTLAGAAARIPSAGSGDSRIRVEKYTMPDGSRQFALYVAGTKLVAPPSEAFDLGSAAELEIGQRSASYDATLEALRDAGAEPGDVVHAFGHSQGAMVTGHLAIEGGYDVRTLVSLGSPIEVDVGPDTLSVSLRHTDDPLAMMTGGGFDHPVGAPGSFVAHRVADPDSGLQDLFLPAHDAGAYTETARLLDVSSDPRMDPVRGLFDQLGTAAAVETTEYAAERP